ncbi:ATP10 protein-domain-containing protein [Podospora australis]|uniref:ATP10 protein-domain-containing protein n=1 Tax=Podospora australis TaxID=1536484 RepID=A0AAN6X3P3_9PEZI|nr:ATP10 protein-domain-containing protein [Podospora australis]
MLSRTGLRTGRRTAACLLCQWRTFGTSYVRLADKPPSPAPAKSTTKPAPVPTAGGPPTPAPDSPLANAPRSYGKKVREFTPTPLSRPIGMNHPPKAGENWGVDTRSIKQRRDDFVDYNKHLARREQLKSKFSRPYFRDWTNINLHKGKTFVAPPRPFKADLSLYFPNLHGRTLGKTPEAKSADTTPLLEGRATIIALFSGVWAENQANTFISAEANPSLHTMIDETQGRAQLVRVNIEEDWLKAMLVRLFMSSMRKQVGEANWDKYFIVRKGITDEIRESIGLLNSKVGYVYLVDHQCRIRWAGSGDAAEGEREGLLRALHWVLEEIKQEGVAANFVRKPVSKQIAGEKK